MDSRETRGRQLAQDPRIKQVDGALWFCPSDKTGGYLVNVETGRCGCPDYAGQRAKCKHLVAVELVQNGQAAQVALTLPATPAKAPTKQPSSDLTAEEQANVRTALRFLKARNGGWAPLAKALRLKWKTLVAMKPSAGLAVRMARFAGVPVDDMLTGRYPVPGSCPLCGRGPDADSRDSAG